jgi:radical SAM superfamily enzyme YgiQ (UPF0313 family)
MGRDLPNPDEALNCLMIYPEFSQFSFWNVKESIATLGAKAPAPPLGLITVAALLPDFWNVKLLDLNTQSGQGVSEEDWNWADLVLTGGMLPQQEGTLSIIKAAQTKGKYVVVGGPDATSQPEIYSGADALVLGEGERTVPDWLQSLSKGQSQHIFLEKGKPDLSESPVPRFDLIHFADYYSIGVQYSRGCPFNCEFCDIIELYGRKPRQKSPLQFLRELQHLFNLGYRGYIDIVDDNFIGNKRHIKRELLPALIDWNQRRRRPFYFGTEASMNIGDDDVLLDLMRRCDFRFIFMGIETPNRDLLMMTQKSQNTMKPMVERIRNIYRRGIIVSAGFIIGFDNEQRGTDLEIIKCIEETSVCLAMVGLLVALPNTQLSRRLMAEKRLLDFNGQVMDGKGEESRALAKDSVFKIIDQTLSGLNFVTTRPRAEILREFVNVTSTVYESKHYMARVMSLVRTMKYRPPRIPSLYEFKRSMRALFLLSYKMTKNPETRADYWRNFFGSLILGLYRFEIALTLMGSFLHLRKQSQHLRQEIQSAQQLTSHLPSHRQNPVVGSTKSSLAPT